MSTSLFKTIESKVHSNRPTELHELKENIRKEIAKLPEETLKPLCAAS
jgi:hypothetical protein